MGLWVCNCTLLQPSCFKQIQKIRGHTIAPADTLRPLTILFRFPTQDIPCGISAGQFGTETGWFWTLHFTLSINTHNTRIPHCNYIFLPPKPQHNTAIKEKKSYSLCTRISICYCSVGSNSCNDTNKGTILKIIFYPCGFNLLGWSFGWTVCVCMKYMNEKWREKKSSACCRSCSNIRASLPIQVLQAQYVTHLLSAKY